MFFGEKGDKNREDPTKKLEESTEMELCFAKRCGSTLVHYGLLAASSPHSSASRAPSPSGKALATPYKLEMLYLLMIYSTTQSLPLGGRWAGVSRVG